MSIDQQLQKAVNNGMRELEQLSSKPYAISLRASFINDRHDRGETALSYVTKGIPMDTYLKLELQDWTKYVKDKVSYLQSQPLC